MIIDLFKLDGRVALVTGAAQGLGGGIAAGLAEAGADVILLDVQSTDETASNLSRTGRSIYNITYDLEHLSSGTAAEIIDLAIELAGRVDILVNNAGIIRRNDAVEYPEDDWRA